MKAEPSLRQRALGCLARREHSRAELQRKLAPHADNAEALAALLDEFERRGWLSEKRVIEQVVHARRARYGSRHIAQKLRDLGVADEAVSRAAADMKAGDLDAAREVRRRKFGALPKTAEQRARQWRFLLGRGFDTETVARVLKDEPEDG